MKTMKSWTYFFELKIGKEYPVEAKLSGDI